MFFRAEDVALKELLAKWSMAFSKVLMCHLRENGNVEGELKVGAEGSAWMQVHCSRPGICLLALQPTANRADMALQDILSPEELRALLASAHRPNFVIQMLAGGWRHGMAW